MSQGGPFLVVGLNPVIQRTMAVEQVNWNGASSVLWSRTDMAGQGGNTARILHQLGHEVGNLCQLGEEDAPFFAHSMEQEGVTVDWVPTAGTIRNCHTIINTSTGEITELVEEGIAVDDGVEDRIRERFTAALPNVRWVVVTGSRAPGFSHEIVPWMVERAKEAGVAVGLDVRGSDLTRSLPFEPDVVKINVPEFVQTFFSGRIALEQAVDAEDTMQITEKLITLTRNSTTAIALSHGKHDSLLAVAGVVQSVPVLSVAVKNTIGCGDSAMAGFVAGRSQGDDFRDALLLGHRCAARNAEVYKPGSLHEGPPVDEVIRGGRNQAEA